MNWLETFRYNGACQYHADHWTSFVGDPPMIQKTVSSDGYTSYTLKGDHYDTEEELLEAMEELKL